MIWPEFDGPRARTVGVLTTPRLIPQKPIVAHRLVGMHQMHTVRRKFDCLLGGANSATRAACFQAAFFALFAESPFQTLGRGGDRVRRRAYIRLRGNAQQPPSLMAGGWQISAGGPPSDAGGGRHPSFLVARHPEGGNARFDAFPCSKNSPSCGVQRFRAIGN